MPRPGRSYSEIYDAFRWAVPERFNIAQAICDRHTGARRTALICETTEGTTTLTFEHLQEQSRRLANALAAQGIERGDRIGILLPQCSEALIVHPLSLDLVGFL
jgi:acetyl-CoA synthetase